MQKKKSGQNVLFLKIFKFKTRQNDKSYQRKSSACYSNFQEHGKKSWYDKSH